MSEKLKWNLLTLEQKVQYLLKFVYVNERAPRAIEEYEGALIGSFWKNLRFSKNKRYQEILQKLILENIILYEDYKKTL